MVRRLSIIFLGVLVSLLFSKLKSTALTQENIESCEQYNIFFEAAFQRYNTPINVLRAVAMHESQCLQSARNPSDGGCGIMQLTGSTRTRVALLLGVSEAALCEDTQEGARLNILGGSAALDDFKCFANPHVFSGLDHSVGHLRSFAAGFEVRVADQLSPESPQTGNAASDQKTAPQPWFRQRG
jgi:Transglycosylase SLT domain